MKTSPEPWIGSIRRFETSRNQSACLYELRATIVWAELVVRHGGTTDAHRALTDVYGRFTEGHRGPDLQRAKAILDRISREKRKT